MKDKMCTRDRLHTAAREIGALLTKGRRIAAVGTPLCLTELDSGVLAALEAEGEQVDVYKRQRHGKAGQRV